MAENKHGPDILNRVLGDVLEPGRLDFDIAVEDGLGFGVDLVADKKNSECVRVSFRWEWD